MDVGGCVFLDGGFTAAGTVRLPGADITGQLSCSGAQLTGAEGSGDAMFADWMKVSGGVFLDGGFTAVGAVRLIGADITGELSCSGARLRATDGHIDALVAERIRVGGSAFLRALMTAGAVRLIDADITGELSCSGAQLRATNSDGDALVADGMKVGDNVVLDEGFTAAGAVRLIDADIAVDLSCTGARLTGTDSDGDALVADGMKVGGDVFLDGFTTAGAVRLSGAAHTGELSCGGAQMTAGDGGDALVANGMTVGHDVFLDGGFTANGTVSLVSVARRRVPMANAVETCRGRAHDRV